MMAHQNSAQNEQNQIRPNMHFTIPQLGRSNVLSPGSTSNLSIMKLSGAGLNSSQQATDSTTQTELGVVSIPMSFLQSILEFKRLSTRMFTDPQLHNTEPFAQYKEHFEVALAKFSHEKQKFVTDNPTNVKYDRTLIDPRLTKCLRSNCRIERSPGFQRQTLVTEAAAAIKPEPIQNGKPSENEWKKQQNICQQFIRKVCLEKHPKNCQCWKDFQESLTKKVCSKKTSTQPNTTIQNCDNSNCQPSTSSSNVTSNRDTNSTSSRHRDVIKEEVVEGIYPLKRTINMTSKDDKNKQTRSSKRLAK